MPYRVKSKVTRNDVAEMLGWAVFKVRQTKEFKRLDFDSVYTAAMDFLREDPDRPQTDDGTGAKIDELRRRLAENGSAGGGDDSPAQRSAIPSGRAGSLGGSDNPADSNSPTANRGSSKGSGRNLGLPRVAPIGAPGSNGPVGNGSVGFQRIAPSDGDDGDM